jgi:predicted extracellular nuclease
MMDDEKLSKNCVLMYLVIILLKIIKNKISLMKNQRNHLLSLAFCLLAIPLSIWVLESCNTPQKAVVTKPSVPVPDIHSPLSFSDAKDSFRVAFYNVENLFDTIDEPRTIDSEYMPNSSLKWNTQRYFAKQKNLSKVIEALNFPTILGMAEVENRRVLEDLTAQPLLAPKNYGITHFESPDERGIDVAMIYKKADFEVKKQKTHVIKFPTSNDKTRDILEVNGILKGGIELTVFVNHFPSRRGGAEESEPKRVYVASVLRKAVDSLFQKDPNARIVIMGDFNDEPSNASLNKTLGATEWQREVAKDLSTNALYNLGAAIERRGEGTEYYRGWDVLDQIIVSGSLLDSRSKATTRDEETVFNADLVIFKDKAGNRLPNRTYTGPIYRGGFSDHFPVFIPIYVK